MSESVLNSWYAWFGTFTGVVALTVLLLPVSAVTAAVLGWRRKVAGVASPWRISVADVGMVHGTVPWVWMILLPGERPGVVRGYLNLVPLRDLLEMDTGQVVGNLFVFAALGFFAPQRFVALASVWRVVALAGGWSVVLEAAQYLWLDRVSSVDDVLLNAAGAGFAAVASRRWWLRSVEVSGAVVEVGRVVQRGVRVGAGGCGCAAWCGAVRCGAAWHGAAWRGVAWPA